MKRFRHKRQWAWLVLLVAVSAPSWALAQQRYRTIEEPRWLTYRISEASVGAYAEGTFESSSFQNTGTSATHDRLFVGPSLGLNLEGSVYHPNLLSYQINSEGAYGWAQETIRTPGSSLHRNEMEYLGRFQGSADLLVNKPYNANVFGAYDHDFRDYDFFNRVIVDTWRYGGRAAFHTESLFLTANYLHRDEDISGLSISSSAHEDVVGFEARHERQTGSTSLNYTFDQYTRTDFGRTGEGTDNTITLADNERFGSRQQFNLNLNTTYSRREANFESSDQLSTAARLTAEHRATLSSAYEVGYDRYTTGSFESDNYAGRASVSHQLYESLNSTLFGQASDYEASDKFNSGYTRRFGVGLAEAYTKRLSADHTLHLNNSVFVEHVDRQSMTTIENERHSFAENLGGPPDSFFLNQPNVIDFSIVVTDANDTPPPFVRGLDYDVIQNGALTIIQRVPGSRIPANGVVLVDYRAEPSSDGSYDALTESFQIRFDLWKNLVGVYSRVSLSLNDAPGEMHIQNLRSYTFGTDVNWRWLRAGAEYQIYDSDQSQYRSARLFQSFTFKPDQDSSLSLYLSQTWTDYMDAHRQEQDYRFITRYHRNLTGPLSLDLEGGFDVRRGRGVDQTLGTARAGLEYVLGKLSVKAGYDYEYQMYLNNEQRSRHLFFIRAKRVF